MKLTISTTWLVLRIDAEMYSGLLMGLKVYSYKIYSNSLYIIIEYFCTVFVHTFCTESVGPLGECSRLGHKSAEVAGGSTEESGHGAHRAAQSRQGSAAQRAADRQLGEGGLG